MRSRCDSGGWGNPPLCAESVRVFGGLAGGTTSAKPPAVKGRMTMKKILLALLPLLAGAGVASADVTVARPPRFEHFHGGVSFGVFYDTLSPYGDWLYVASYGLG